MRGEEGITFAAQEAVIGRRCVWFRGGVGIVDGGLMVLPSGAAQEDGLQERRIRQLVFEVRCRVGQGTMASVKDAPPGCIGRLRLRADQKQGRHRKAVPAVEADGGEVAGTSLGISILDL
eukprot:14182748-Heterocapsa_arctica.AAC.1